ncbi:MAG: hypothetical protein B6229_05860 [Spirochaetaceae bacterium 4572_7]|nr:MAG: hypothetical protein B6229_05860 [Spirochaetaceae bacterium 4572_7]
MNKFFKAVLDLRELEQYSNKKNIINDINPEIKVVLVSFYILLVTTINKYNLSLVLIVGIVPTVIFFLTEIEGKVFLFKLIIPVFLSITFGILNPFLDIDFFHGIISLLTLVLKSTFTISMTLLLVCTTPIKQLIKGFSFFKIPKSIIYLFFLMYRYIVILLEEIGRTMDAYSLRATMQKGLHSSSWGSLVGQIVIRSYYRSENIYQAMLIRGIDLDSE